jgi:hypothetical protein
MLAMGPSSGCHITAATCQDGETQHDTAAGMYAEPRANRAENYQSREGVSILAIRPLEIYIQYIEE